MNLPLWAKGLITAGILLFLTLIVAGMTLNFVDSYELGYKFDKRTGETTILNRTGWFVTPPWLVSVNTVDLRPCQVCINANNRVLNCKLVQFNPEGLQTFLSWHGRNNYEVGTSTYDTPFSEILKSYAYSGDANGTYPFLHILKELKPESATLDSLPSPIDTIKIQ